MDAKTRDGEPKSLLKLFRVRKDPDHFKKKFDSYDYSIAKDTFELILQDDLLFTKKAVVNNLCNILTE